MDTKAETAEQEFRRRLSANLTRYYGDTVGLDRLEDRISYRETEDVVEEARLKNLLARLDLTPHKNLRMLVVGSGWGGMCLAASRLGICVQGIDIDTDAVEISRLRFLKEDQPIVPIHCAAAEDLPFPDDSFDLVYCFSVMEHVNDVEATIKEIARVLRPGGQVYLHTPNYNIPWEPHYKMILPTFLGQGVCKVVLRLRGRNPSYLDTVNFIKPRKLVRMINKYGLQLSEQWDIVRNTIIKSDEPAIRKETQSRKSRLRYVKRFDEYSGALVWKLWRLFGVNNIYLICRKSD